MTWTDRLILFGVLAGLVGLTLWLQFGVIEQTPAPQAQPRPEDPDYYIVNFTAVGMDESGERKYVLEAERMVHYPADDTALLDNPHVIQYQPGQAPRHTYADSGWVGPNGNEVIMTGNVRVIEGQQGEDGGGVMTTDRLRLLLDREAEGS